MIWNNLRHFKETEAWGDPSKMNQSFLLQLDYFRDLTGVPFVVTSGFATEGHAPNSYHYLGRAVDGRFVDSKGRVLSLEDHLILAMRSPFTGIGIYTHSRNGPFVHFDNRSALGERKIWVCEMPGRYQMISKEFLNRHC